MLASLPVNAPPKDLSEILLPAQLRGARAMLDWTRRELAAASHVPLPTVTKIEAGLVERPRKKTVHALRNALLAAGIEFVDSNGGGPGVRFTREAATRITVAKAKGAAPDNLVAEGIRSSVAAKPQQKRERS